MKVCSFCSQFLLIENEFIGSLLFYLVRVWNVYQIVLRFTNSIHMHHEEILSYILSSLMLSQIRYKSTKFFSLFCFFSLQGWSLLIVSGLSFSSGHEKFLICFGINFQNFILCSRPLLAELLHELSFQITNHVLQNITEIAYAILLRFIFMFWNRHVKKLQTKCKK